MKKKILLGVGITTFVFASSASAYFITSSNEDTKPTSARVENVKKEEPKNVEEVSKPVEETEKVNPHQLQPSEQIASPQQSNTSPEENKEKIMSVITNFAQSKGRGQSEVFAQTNCFDRAFTSGNLYGNYESLINYPSLQQYLNGTFRFDGGGTCKPIVYPTPIY